MPELDVLYVIPSSLLAISAILAVIYNGRSKQKRTDYEGLCALIRAERGDPEPLTLFIIRPKGDKAPVELEGKAEEVEQLTRR